MKPQTVDAVVIGRNEGARLRDCLASLAGQVRRLVYVDSGSTDGSADLARGFSAQVVVLDRRQPFTAARARNAGLAQLAADPPQFVQFVDGDCTLDAGWLAKAVAFLADQPKVVVVCGRRRERFPQVSVYNRLIDAEWDTPVGEARACGGDALMRFDAVQAAGGYRAGLIAGEEPEMCLRLRRAGGVIWRLEAEMTLHDAGITSVRQWWQRSRRAGHAFAEGAALHGAGPEAHWVRETRRALLWGAVLPLGVATVAVLADPGALWLLVAWPMQVVRLAFRDGAGLHAWQAAFFSVLGKLPEAQGVLGYHAGQVFRRRAKLIEYK
nr:glycosyltransferase family A protein [Rhodobacter sp. SW2]